MSSEILQPFQLASNGGVAITTDPNEQTEQHIQSLISTSPTERVMIPTYGTGVKGAVFTPNNVSVGNILSSEIQTGMQQWEPNVTVNDIIVTPVTDPSAPVQVTLDWSINTIQSGTSSGVQTASILVGGTVIQDGVIVP